jgi:hypothetical protein
MAADPAECIQMTNAWEKTEWFAVMSADGEVAYVHKTPTADAIHDHPRIVSVAPVPRVEWSVTALGGNGFRIGGEQFVRVGPLSESDKTRCVIDSHAEEHRPRRGARPSKPLRRETASGGFDSFLFRKNRAQKALTKSQDAQIYQQFH